MHGLKREIEGRQRRANSVWGMQNWELVNRKYLSALYFRWQTIWDGAGIKRSVDLSGCRGERMSGNGMVAIKWVGVINRVLYKM